MQSFLRHFSPWARQRTAAELWRRYNGRVATCKEEKVHGCRGEVHSWRERTSPIPSTTDGVWHTEVAISSVQAFCSFAHSDGCDRHIWIPVCKTDVTPATKLRNKGRASKSQVWQCVLHFGHAASHSRATRFWSRALLYSMRLWRASESRVKDA